ncbi:MAG: AAA family ATPase [Pigmentiphaga sp.]
MNPSLVQPVPLLGPALQRQLRAGSDEPVELIETHISWIVLTANHAYKLKKPVCLPFLDFTELAQRRHYCEEELRLNQRLAPGLYLDVVAIGGTAAAPILLKPDGTEAVIDYAVRMRRFGKDALLAERVAAGETTVAELRDLARDMAGFHGTAAAAVPDANYASPAQIEGAVQDVLTQLERTDHADRLPAWHDWVQAESRALAPHWRSRRSQGFVREGHGDLHLANVVWFEGRLQAFDCLEFQPAFRWLDVMNDIGFLTMDLRAHGRPDLAAGLLDDYLQYGGDYDGLRVLRFYEVYRALVRLLVAGLRGDPLAAEAAGGGHAEVAKPRSQEDQADASVPRTASDAAQAARRTARRRPDYRLCLDELLRQDATAPRLVLTQGLSGSGKSTVARQLVEQFGMIRLRSDVERKRLFGLAPEQASRVDGLDIYTPEATRQTFGRLEALAETVLAAGYAVVVDATFLRRDERRRFQVLAQRLGVAYAILQCEAGLDTLRARIRRRAAQGGDPSEVDEAVLERQLHWHEALGDDERPWARRISTETPVTAEALVAAMRVLVPSSEPGIQT